MIIPYKQSPLAWGGGGIHLPSGYKRCEYLVGDGRQYINTGLILSGDDTVEMEFQIDNLSASGDGCFTYGGRDGYRGNRCHYLVINGGANCDIAYGNLLFSQTSVPYWNEKLYLLNSPTLSVLKGERFTYFNEPHESRSFTTPYTAYVFAMTTGSGDIDNRTLAGKVWWFSIAGKMHLIPALDKSGTPCMYDAIGGKAYYNAGTGQFLYKLA